MKKIILVMLLITSLVSLAASGANEHEAKAVQTYTFGGSTTVAPIANAALTAFLADRPHVKITYETLGSSTGIKQLQEGTLSLAGSSRELKSSELEAGLKPIVIALDGLSVAVNSNVPIANLSMHQLSQIFAGEITNWKEVG